MSALFLLSYKLCRFKVLKQNQKEIIKADEMLYIARIRSSHSSQS